MGSISDMSYMDGSLETPNNSPHSNKHQEVVLFKDSKENPPPTLQVLVHKPWTESLPALSYVVSLLHALPFVFQAKALLTIMEGEFSKPLNPLKLVEASHKLALRDPHFNAHPPTVHALTPLPYLCRSAQATKHPTTHKYGIDPTFSSIPIPVQMELSHPVPHISYHPNPSNSHDKIPLAN